MATSIAKQKQKLLVRNAILTVTEQIILQKGWQEVSIRKIAEAIGYSLPIVYTHFESKEAIQKEFVRRGFSKLTNALKNLAGLEHEEQLLQLATNYYDFAVTNPAYYKVMFGVGIPSCKEVQETDEIAEFTQVIIQQIKFLANYNDETKIFLKFHTFWSILHGLTSINMVNLIAQNNQQHQILIDAIQGFIKNINN